jgi:hypothetical protein
MINWFAANKFVLNLDKTDIMKFITNNSSHSTLHAGYKEKYVEKRVNTKFLGLKINNHLNCKNYIKQIIPKLSGTCYAISSMVHISNINTLKSIYYAYFRSIIKYEIVFCSNSSNSWKIFALQKKIVRIMAGQQPRTSCKSQLKQLQILPVPCQYIFSVMNFTVSNQETFQIHLYTILIQGIITICIDQMPTYHVFKNVHFMLASKFSTAYHVV